VLGIVGITSDVPLADVVVEALSRHIAEHGTGEHGLLLHRPDGAPVHHQRFDQEWRRLRRLAAATAGEEEDGAALAARLERVKFHGTRHTYASTLLSGGVSVAAAADYLGHTPGELLRTYAHLMPADHDRARSVVQAAFDSTPRVPAVSRACQDDPEAVAAER
jgi:integrase